MLKDMSLPAGNFLRGQSAARIGLTVYAPLLCIFFLSCQLYGSSRGAGSTPWSVFFYNMCVFVRTNLCKGIRIERSRLYFLVRLRISLSVSWKYILCTVYVSFVIYSCLMSSKGVSIKYTQTTLHYGCYTSLLVVGPRQDGPHHFCV